MKSLRQASPQQVQQETARLARRIFTAPRPDVLIGPIVVLSLALGLVDAGFTWEALQVGTYVFLVPTLLTAIVSTPLARALGGRHYLRRSFLLAFVSLGMAGIVLIIWRLIDVLVGGTGLSVPGLILVVSSTMWMRLITLYATSKPSMARSLPVASTQPIFGYITIFVLYGSDTLTIGLSVALFLVFSSAAFLLIISANLPFRHSFGIDGIRMVSHFLDYMTEGGDRRAKDIESFFNSFSIPITAEIGIVAFRTKKGIKALVVVPNIHPGPFAQLGGSNLPAKLLEDLRDLTPNLFVPHGPATHDFNPPTSQECRKIAAEVRHLLKDMKYSNKSSLFVRSRKGLAHTCAQMFDDSIIIVGGMAPNPTDDIDHSTGYAAANEGRSAGAKDALFIDAHNCMEEGSGLVLFGSQASRDMLESSSNSSREAMRSRTKGMKMGYAQESGFIDEREGLGDMGIQALVVKNDGQTVAYLLFDGNNMIPGLRERLQAASREFVDDAEILTTDNHAVNATLGGYNPVGWKADENLIVQKTRDALKAAVENIEDVEVGVRSGTIHGFRVFGHQSATRLATVVSSTLSTLRINTFYSLLVAFALSGVVLLAARTMG